MLPMNLCEADMIRAEGRVTEIDVRLKTLDQEAEALREERRKIRGIISIVTAVPSPERTLSVRAESAATGSK